MPHRIPLSIHSFFIFLITWKTTWHLSIAHDMNRLRVANFPVRLYMSLSVRGDFILMTAQIFLGLALIPLWLIIKPKNFPKDTSNTHFSGFSFILYCLSSSKASSKCNVCSVGSLNFVIMSSTYISIVLPINGLKILFTNL